MDCLLSSNLIDAAFFSSLRHSYPLQSFSELWGEGSSFEGMAADVIAKSSHLMSKYGSSQISWKMIVDHWGGCLSQRQQVSIIEKMAFLAFKVRHARMPTSRACLQSFIIN